MNRFCFRCKTPVSPERVRRGSIYCNDECRRLAKIEALRERAKKKCRLCGNKLPKVLAHGGVRATAKAAAAGKK